MSSLPQLLAYTHHPGYLTANINDALKNVNINVPDLEALVPSDLKPTVPYDEIPVRKRKRSGNVKRFHSRGEVFLNQIRSKKAAKQELSNSRHDRQFSPDCV